MAKTVVGLFNSTSEAEKVKQELIDDGYEADQLNVIANGGSYSGTPATGSTNTGSNQSNRSVGEKIEHFFSNLMGGDDDVHEHYASGVNQGGALLAVRTDDADAEEVADWLDEHGARKVDRNPSSVNTSGSGGSGYRDNLSNTTGTAAATGTAAGEYNAGVLAAGSGTGSRAGANTESYNDKSTVSGYNQNDATLQRDRGDRDSQDSKTIPVVEEEIEVGKRRVERGGVRVYTHVTETPVEESVTLREENINVERRAVDRPATSADFSANQGKVIEMYAQSEEAVVGKKSRVVEEVVVGKEVNQRTEQVHDSVRKTEVDVEEFDGSDRKGSDRTSDAASYTGANKTERG